MNDSLFNINTTILTVQLGHLGVDHALIGVRVLDGGVVVGDEIGLGERRRRRVTHLNRKGKERERDLLG